LTGSRGQENGHLIGNDFAVKLGFDLSGKDPLLPATTGCLPVAQFVAGQEPFVAFGYVPSAVFTFIHISVL
jgi:hypothetical protein